MPQNYSPEVSDRELAESYWLVTHYKKIKHFFVIALAIFDALLIVFSIWTAVLLYGGQARLAEKVSRIILDTLAQEQSKPIISDISIESVGSRPAAEGIENGYTLIANQNDHWYFHGDLVFSRGSADVRSVPIVLLPGEKRFFIGLGIPTGQPALTASLRAKRWNFLSQDDAQLTEQLNDVKITNSAFKPADSSGISRITPVSKLTFMVSNNSIVDFWEVRLPIVAKDKGVVVAVGEAVVSSLASGEKKSVETTWFVPIISADEFDIKALVDIVDPHALKQKRR